MRHLILVRHGEYGSFSRTLTTDGRRQIKHLGEQLRPYVVNKKVLILSSTAKRASETTEILIRKIRDAPVEHHECLASLDKELTQEEISAATVVLSGHESRYDVVIISTHYPYVSQFPSIWAKRYGHEVETDSEPEKGCARIYDTRTGTITKIPGLDPHK